MTLGCFTSSTPNVTADISLSFQSISIQSISVHFHSVHFLSVHFLSVHFHSVHFLSVHSHVTRCCVCEIFTQFIPCLTTWPNDTPPIPFLGGGLEMPLLLLASGSSVLIVGEGWGMLLLSSPHQAWLLFSDSLSPPMLSYGAKISIATTLPDPFFHFLFYVGKWQYNWDFNSKQQLFPVTTILNMS